LHASVLVIIESSIYHGAHKTLFLEQGSGTHGSRARCGSFD